VRKRLFSPAKKIKLSTKTAGVHCKKQQEAKKKAFIFSSQDLYPNKKSQQESVYHKFPARVLVPSWQNFPFSSRGDSTLIVKG